MKTINFNKKFCEGMPSLLARSFPTRLLDLLGLDLFIYQPIPIKITRRSNHDNQKRI